MPLQSKTCALLAPALLFAPLFMTAAHAENFYQGKTIAIITSTGAGGSFDHAARALTRHMPRHIPGNPNMIVQNMPGGGHTRATNFLYNQAPKDGTVLGTVGYTIPMHQVVDGRGVHFDARDFNWIGGVGISNLAMMVWHTAGVESVDDLRKKEVTTGATGTGSAMYLYANVMNRMLGTRYRIITGYKQSVDVDLAMERGEVEGRGGASFSSVPREHPKWISDNLIRVIAQVGVERDELLPNVPLLTELAETDDARQVLRYISLPVGVGRPYLAPPGVPAERVALLRKAFDATMKDKEYISETDKMALDIRPISGEDLAKVIDEIVSISPELLEKVKEAIKVDTGG